MTVTNILKIKSPITVTNILINGFKITPWGESIPCVQAIMAIFVAVVYFVTFDALVSATSNHVPIMSSIKSHPPKVKCTFGGDKPISNKVPPRQYPAQIKAVQNFTSMSRVMVVVS